jgi:uncharacterized tellurite resistance protein B-like protein
MSTNLTIIEKRAITAVLIDIANADGVVKNSEVALLAAIQEVLEISASDVHAAKNMSVAQCLRIISNLSLADKELFRMLMLKLINIDGSIDDNELEVFVVVCAATGIPLPK